VEEEEVHQKEEEEVHLKELWIQVQNLHLHLLDSKLLQ